MIEAHDAWTIRFQPQRDIVVFGQAFEGDVEIIRDDRPALHISTGDFMLMASPPHWEMRAQGGASAVDFKAVLAEPRWLAKSGADRVVTRFIAGHFTFDAAGAELLARLMAPTILIHPGQVAAERLGVLLELLKEEANAERAGGAEVVKRLLEVLLVEVLRSPGAGLDTAQPGLVAGLADPRIGRALNLLHDDVVRRWTVGELAREVGMSRSIFAARFNAVVGSPPMDYLATWRMLLAKQALLARDVPMPDIAELAGYQSVSAFSTAFRRSTGGSPTAYVRASTEEA